MKIDNDLATDFRGIIFFNKRTEDDGPNICATFTSIEIWLMRANRQAH